MQITVYGATGTFGRRLVSQLHERGHTTIAAHRGSGVDTVTGEGVAEAAEGSDVLVDCVNRMTMRADRAIDFFSRSSRSIALAAAEAARMMAEAIDAGDRKSTRLNSSHVAISYAVFCTTKTTKKSRII